MPKYHMPNWEDSLFFKGQNRGRKGRKLTPSDEPTVPAVQASVHLVQYVKEAQFTQTVGWTDGVLSSCTGWIGEEEPRRQQRRINRRSIGGNRRSIRWSCLNKTETRQDEALSTGWTDGLAVVHPTVAWKLTETIWPRGLQHRMNRWCVGA
jgi:hypothetical protein